MANDIDRVVAALQAAAESVIKQITLDATANLIETTPVDTGFAKGSWIPSVGRPSAAVGGEPGSPSGAAQRQGMAEAAGYRLSRGAVFIANNVRYIQKLNEGSSKQAPAGFIQAAIAKAVRSVKI